jgi:hypothetical protein
VTVGSSVTAFEDMRAERDAWRYRTERAERDADRLAEAIRRTREYVGEATLPNVEGWSHFDAMCFHAGAVWARTGQGVDLEARRPKEETEVWASDPNAAAGVTLTRLVSM